MRMLMIAMNDSKRSVDPENYQRYLDMRERFEKSKTTIDNAMAGLNSAPQGNQLSSEANLPSAPVAQPTLDDDDDDDEDIYA